MQRGKTKTTSFDGESQCRRRNGGPWRRFPSLLRDPARLRCGAENTILARGYSYLNASDVLRKETGPLENMNGRDFRCSSGEAE